MTWDAILSEKGVRNDWLSRIFYHPLLPSYTSQRGEDRVLQVIFHLIGETNRWSVEFGATDGVAYSNSWYWINERGWSSVQIEAARDKNLELRTRDRWSFDALMKNYGLNDRVICLNQMVLPEGETSLDALLVGTPIPRRFDLLSIDIDSMDYDIWESLTDYEPRVVIVEHNKTIPIEVSWHSPIGSSLRAYYELGKEKGYELVAANDLNAIFVRHEFFSEFDISDNDPAKLWTKSRDFETRMWTLVDGTPYFSGRDTLRWVRGVDGTVMGQFSAGKFKMIGRDVVSATKTLPRFLPVKLSGVLRHLFYIMQR